jgi:hypothetical protein
MKTKNVVLRAIFLSPRRGLKEEGEIFLSGGLRTPANYLSSLRDYRIFLII